VRDETSAPSPCAGGACGFLLPPSDGPPEAASRVRGDVPAPVDRLPGVPDHRNSPAASASTILCWRGHSDPLFWPPDCGSVAHENIWLTERGPAPGRRRANALARYSRPRSHLVIEETSEIQLDKPNRCAWRRTQTAQDPVGHEAATPSEPLRHDSRHASDHRPDRILVGEIHKEYHYEPKYEGSLNFNTRSYTTLSPTTKIVKTTLN